MPFKDPEQRREYEARRYRESREQRAQYRRDNREHVNAWKREWAKRNREELTRRAREKRHADPEKALAEGRQQTERKRTADPEGFRASARVRSARYREGHRDQVNASRRELHATQQADPEYRAANVERARAWAAANPERSREHHRKKEARRRAAKRCGSADHVDPFVVLEMDDGACGICGGDVDPANFHLDHIVPLCRGGDHNYANVQAAHPSCNLAKAGRLP